MSGWGGYFLHRLTDRACLQWWVAKKAGGQRLLGRRLLDGVLKIAQQRAEQSGQLQALLFRHLVDGGMFVDLLVLDDLAEHLPPFGGDAEMVGTAIATGAALDKPALLDAIEMARRGGDSGQAGRRQFGQGALSWGDSVQGAE